MLTKGVLLLLHTFVWPLTREGILLDLATISTDVGIV
jgi:hypothetical protein